MTSDLLLSRLIIDKANASKIQQFPNASKIQQFPNVLRSKWQPLAGSNYFQGQKRFIPPSILTKHSKKGPSYPNASGGQLKCLQSFPQSHRTAGLVVSTLRCSTWKPQEDELYLANGFVIVRVGLKLKRIIEEEAIQGLKESLEGMARDIFRQDIEIIRLLRREGTHLSKESCLHLVQLANDRDLLIIALRRKLVEARHGDNSMRCRKGRHVHQAREVEADRVGNEELNRAFCKIILANGSRVQKGVRQSSCADCIELDKLLIETARDNLESDHEEYFCEPQNSAHPYLEKCLEDHDLLNPAIEYY